MHPHPAARLTDPGRLMQAPGNKPPVPAAQQPATNRSETPCNNTTKTDHRNPNHQPEGGLW